MVKVSIPIKDPVTVNPKLLGGIPVIKGTRIPASLVLELLHRGYSQKLISVEYPSLTVEKIAAFLKLISRSYDVSAQKTI